MTRSQTSPDHATRLSALDPRASFILEAPAGSGKTDLLAARFLKLLSQASNPRQIVAVTFTRKAAREMQGRILGILKRARLPDPPKNSWDEIVLGLACEALANPALTPAILDNPEAYRIETFHGFCSSLIGSWPLEAGIPPGISLLDDLDQDESLESCATETIRLIARGEDRDLAPALERRLAACNNRPSTLAGQIVSLLKGRDKLRLFEERRNAAHLDIGEETLRLLGAYVGHLLAPLREHFLHNRSRWDDLRAMLLHLEAPASDAFPSDVPGLSLEDIPLWTVVAGLFLTGKGTPYKSFTAKSGFPAGFGKTDAAGFITNTPPDIAQRLAFVRAWPLPGDDPAGLVALADTLSLTQRALERLAQRRASQGLDYLDLEMAALRALSWRGAVPSRSLISASENLRHVLVDEAQDMNDVQVEILGRLTEGWEPGDGRSLFVVGDPKQSIYRFRRADVALFRELQDAGLARSGEAPYPLNRLNLTANFRSRPSLVTFANLLFEQVMATSAPSSIEEVAFQASEPALDEMPPAVPVTVALFAKDEEDAGTATMTHREREAAWIAAHAAALHAGDPSSTVAVLLPARTHVAAYAKAFADMDVAVRLVEGEPLAARPEVRHLLGLFTALSRPHDDIPWAGALRAPWCRATAQELLDLSRNLDGRFWSEAVLGRAGEDTLIGRFGAAANEALQAFGREPYDATLSRLWEDLGGPGATASYYGAAGVANARAFLALLGSCSGLPCELALARLSRLLEKAYTPPDPRGAFSPISIMTIHKAKGLEFDHVICAHLDKSPLGRSRQGEESPFLLARLPLEGRPMLAASGSDALGEGDTLAGFLIGALDKERTRSESKRLFYVAATRARRSLALTGCVHVHTSGEVAPRSSDSALARLLKAIAEEGQLRPAFASLGVRLLPVNPVAEAPSPLPRMPIPLPAPPPFDPEPLPYRLKAASALENVEDETGLPSVYGGSKEAPGLARARGVVMHRIFETLAQGGDLPPEAAVRAALAGEGVAPETAKAEAPSLVEEAAACWEMPAFAALRLDAGLYPEWAIEDYDGAGTFRVGRLDLLLKTPGGPCVIDYKTGRPEGDGTCWMEGELARFAPQVGVYRQMVAGVEGVSEKDVRVFVLFTATARLVPAP